MDVELRTEEKVIIKPRNDKREYRVIILQNKLKVLLISDPETDKCAASMDVCVGYFSDPDELPGLANFLEHMLFYASEKYPLEDSYSEYISKHGGHSSAFTSSIHTNHHFDINADGYEEALDRFAHFFIKPLISADATRIQLAVVESEYQMHSLFDGWRLEQLEKHLTAESHPYHKFILGNRRTLETEPKKRGLDIREEVLRFYEENYSANQMHLAIYSKDDLDKCESLVRSKFQDIRNTDRSSINFPGQPCDLQSLQILVKAVPIEYGHKLIFVWPITCGLRHYMEGPSQFLSHLIGHKGEGSLFDVLKKLGWATSLIAGDSEVQCEFSFFSVTVGLTDVGQKHFEDIAALLFNYIDLILSQPGSHQRIFNEISAMCENSFHYQDKIQPFDYVIKVAMNMKFYPEEDWLVGSSMPSRFASEMIQSVLKELNPYNVRIFWVSTTFEGLTDFIEPWSGAKYSLERLNDSTIKQWIQRAPNEDLHLPAPNMFIPTDLSLKTDAKQRKFPVLQRNSSYSRFWYKPDTTFSTPKAYMNINFHCPMSKSSPKAVLLTEFFTHLLNEDLNETAYYAQLAGLDIEIYSNDYGFQIKVYGFNDKMNDLLETVIQRIANFEVRPERFAVIKGLFEEKCQNFQFVQPREQAMYYYSLILEDKTMPWTEKLEVLSHLQAEDLVKFYPELLSRIFLECYAAGNLHPNEAESMIHNVEDVFFGDFKPLSRPMLESQHMIKRILRLERGINYFYSVEGLNSEDQNSAVIHYIQVHQDELRMNVLVELFALMAKQADLHQLRSVLHIGYIAELVKRDDAGTRGVQFIIQSAVQDPKGIDLILDSFLKNFGTLLRNMPMNEFKTYVNKLITMKLAKKKNLEVESGFFMQEISNRTLMFNSRENEVAALKKLSQRELIDFFNAYIDVGAPEKKCVNIRISGSNRSLDYKAGPNIITINSIFTFKQHLSLYGLPRCFHMDKS